jgi:hypothetical protein
MNNNNNIYFRYFLFSLQQRENRLKIESINGNKPTFGIVIVNGVPKEYTEIVTSLDNVRYPDYKVLIAGDIRKISYTEPSD